MRRRLGLRSRDGQLSSPGRLPIRDAPSVHRCPFRRADRSDEPRSKFLSALPAPHGRRGAPRRRARRSAAGENRDRGHLRAQRRRRARRGGGPGDARRARRRGAAGAAHRGGARDAARQNHFARRERPPAPSRRVTRWPDGSGRRSRARRSRSASRTLGRPLESTSTIAIHQHRATTAAQRIRRAPTRSGAFRTASSRSSRSTRSTSAASSSSPDGAGRRTWARSPARTRASIAMSATPFPAGSPCA